MNNFSHGYIVANPSHQYQSYFKSHTNGRPLLWYTYYMDCVSCLKVLNTRQKKYCSNQCQHDQQYQDYIASWKKGKEDGNRGHGREWRR